MACGSLAHWASENEKLLAQKENLLVPDDRMALFPALNMAHFSPFTVFRKRAENKKTFESLLLLEAY